MWNSSETAADMDATQIDLSKLVGYEIKIFSEQFPGKALGAKVSFTKPGQISVDSGARFGNIENLVNLQTVVLQLTHKGQQVSVKAQLRRAAGGRCTFMLQDKATPLARRRFVRLQIQRSVRLAAFPVAAHARRDLKQLRWMATDSVSLSSGGLAVKVPTFLEKGVLLLISVEWEENLLPPILLGRVKHCFQEEDGQFLTGVEFLVDEESQRLFPPFSRRSLPGSLFTYSNEKRARLNRKLHLLKKN